MEVEVSINKAIRRILLDILNVVFI
jgi:hypothetical protein